MSLSPQKEIIVAALRSGKWVCGREWLDRIKDDRKRISELNEGYMREKGYEIIGEPCRTTACGRRTCPLYKRKAVKLVVKSPHESPQKETTEALNKAQIKWFNEIPQKA